jgi:hypothetical protein
MSGPVKFEHPWRPMNRLIIKSLVHILRDIMSGELDEPISDGRRLDLIPDEFDLNDLSDPLE